MAEFDKLTRVQIGSDGGVNATTGDTEAAKGLEAYVGEGVEREFETDVVLKDLQGVEEGDLKDIITADLKEVQYEVNPKWEDVKTDTDGDGNADKEAEMVTLGSKIEFP